jgi:hypothetical protein
MQIAKRWREDHGYRGRGGVIVVYDGEAQGWVEKLRNPAHWRPGCIAVAEDGICSEAAGGNWRDGARRWQPCASLGLQRG